MPVRLLFVSVCPTFHSLAPQPGLTIELLAYLQQVSLHLLTVHTAMF